MIISIIYLVISFLLEGIMSNIFPSTLSNISYFTTIYIIISFAIIYPYFDNDKKFFILIFIFGILFDIIKRQRFATSLPQSDNGQYRRQISGTGT